MKDGMKEEEERAAGIKIYNQYSAIKRLKIFYGGSSRKQLFFPFIPSKESKTFILISFIKKKSLFSF